MQAMALRVLAPPALMILVTPATMPAQEAGFEATHGELRSQTAGRVGELAKWCQEHRLYLERDRLYAALLELDPEHKQARRFLHYRRKQGTWEQADYVAPENRAPEFLDELETQEGVLVALWRAELTGLLHRFDASLEEPQRTVLLQDVLILAPDDAETRALVGEVRDPAGDGWIPAKNLERRLRRESLLARAAELRDTPVKIERTELPPDQSFLPWKTAMRPPNARLSIVGPEDLAAQLTAHSAVAVELFREVFGEVPILPRELTFFVLDRADSMRSYQAREGGRGSKRALCSGEEPGTGGDVSLALWEPRTEIREEHALRMLVQRFLLDSFGIGQEDAWASEGFASCLTELALGHRGGPSAAERATLESRRMAMVQLLRKPAAELGAEDLILARSLAGYLIECHAPELSSLLDDLGRSPEDAQSVLQKHLSMDLASLEECVTRWATEERGSVKAPRPRAEK